MKNLRDYLNEKKGDTSKPHPVSPGEGADDKKYVALMVEYKTLRRQDDRKEAKKVMEKAMKLAKEGDVSEKCRTMVAYL